MEIMAAAMDRQIEGAISENERLSRVNDALVDALSELLRECRMHTGWPSDLSTYAKADAALTAAGAA